MAPIGSSLANLENSSSIDEEEEVGYGAQIWETVPK